MPRIVFWRRRSIERRRDGVVATHKTCFAVALGAMSMILPVSSLAMACQEDGGRKVRNPFEGNSAAVQAGHQLFNETCAHCHGPDAVTGIMERNLRHLSLRYGDATIETFCKTVLNGRPEKGMPTWQGKLDDDNIWKIYTWLETVQSTDD